MLQMPTSTFSMFSSSSKSLDGFFGLICVGIQLVLAVVLSEPKTEFTTAVRATATVKVVLQPTKCVLSDDTSSFPYVAAMGCAAIVLFGLFYILCAKRFKPVPPRASHTEKGFSTGDEPPSPPSDPDTESNAKKHRNNWLRLFLILLVSMVLLSLGASLFLACMVPSRRVLYPLESFCARTLRIVDRKFHEGWSLAASNISALGTHLSLHRRQYTKIGLLALASHSACITLGFGFCRLRRFMFNLGGDWWAMPAATVFVPHAILAAFPQLRWPLWMVLYSKCEGQLFVPMHHINRILSCFSFLAKFNSPGIAVRFYAISLVTALIHVTIQIVVGPIIIHTIAACLGTLILGFNGIHPTRRAANNFFSWRRLRNFYLCCTVFCLAYHVVAYWTVFACFHYSVLFPHLQPLVWESLFCPKAWETLRPTVWFLLDRYQTWKSDQIDEFAALIPELRRLFMAGFAVCWETWGALDSFDQLMILGPAAVFYGHLDVTLAKIATLVLPPTIKAAILCANLTTRSGDPTADTDAEDRRGTNPRQKVPNLLRPPTRAVPGHRAQHIPQRSSNPSREYTHNIPLLLPVLKSLTREYTPNSLIPDLVPLSIHPAQVARPRIYAHNITQPLSTLQGVYSSISSSGHYTRRIYPQLLKLLEDDFFWELRVCLPLYVSSQQNKGWGKDTFFPRLVGFNCAMDKSQDSRWLELEPMLKIEPLRASRGSSARNLELD
ncbi:hypothetical protein B0H16DRAFT_1703879 [Mycena metata]|uniref:Uncharacterized protein n=1 Tax=Mycena metata TaxID=1033252 RepID=A0AAD7H0X1_9AGAR|nr:hypothetical protein B0H16DRAFT_1703879 [Mycena metata]